MKIERSCQSIKQNNLPVRQVILPKRLIAPI